MPVQSPKEDADASNKAFLAQIYVILKNYGTETFQGNSILENMICSKVKPIFRDKRFGKQ